MKLKNAFIIAISIFAVSSIAFATGSVIAEFFVVHPARTTLLGPPNRYIQVGDGSGTTHGLDSNKDMVIEGDLEVKGTAYIPTGLIQFAGITTTGGPNGDGTYDGDDAGTHPYTDANAICAGAYAGSHVCHERDIQYLIAQGQDWSSVATKEVWMVGGHPGYTAPMNDCNGFTNAGALGNTWPFNSMIPNGGGCGNKFAFACCK